MCGLNRFQNCQVTDLSDICAALETNTTLRSLKWDTSCGWERTLTFKYSLSFNMVTDLAALCRVLATNTTLTSLELVFDSHTKRE